MEKGKMQLAEERWLTKHGFSFRIIKEKQSRVVYEIEKEGFAQQVELPKALSSLDGYMKIVADTWRMAKELTEKGAM